MNKTENKLKMVVFSDLRTHSIEKCMEIIKDIEPDIILYGGDDIDRFESLPKKTLKQIVEQSFNTFNKECIYYAPFVKIDRRSSATLSDVAVFYFKKEKKKYTKKEIINYLSNYIFNNSNDFEIRRMVRKMDNHGNKEPPLEDIKNFLEKQIIYHIDKNEGIGGLIYFSNKKEYFKKLAELSKYGLCFVLGNDNHPIYREIGIKHKNVYDVHTKPLVIGDFVIIGLEGAPTDIKFGYILSHDDKTVKKHLDNMANKYKNKKIIVLSHAPPYNILDYTIRFGEKHIGSKPLLEFIKEKKPLLVACGHVHREGGNDTLFENTHIINVASHDDNLSHGNMALIEIEENEIKTKWIKIPSNFELAVNSAKTGDELYNNLYELGVLYERECKILRSAIEEFGDEFVSDFPSLCWNIKYKYGFSLSHVVELYRMGVKKPEDIKKEHAVKLVQKIKNGLSKLILKTAFSKVFAKEGELIILSNDLGWLFEKKVAYLDVEYINSSNVVLYGFLIDGKIKQFSIGEEEGVVDLVNKLISEGYKILHYGGDDRNSILNLFRSRKIKLKPVKEAFINVCHKIKTQLAIPIQSKTLKDVCDYFDNSEKKIKRFEYKLSDGRILTYEGTRPYDFDGMRKVEFCNKILEAYQNDVDFKNMEEYHLLKGTNEVDLYDLQKIVNNLRDKIKQKDYINIPIDTIIV
ncbi:metallophosphoesterase family protein [Methanococcus aeolicus]|uniref:metallophosphoesterase family protein n=1 Tax=Methanococcus aeolicus TaxID=42879 RepID=UPI0021CA9993|nr:metallophosphoesterase [Methanococcus aeolicus]UXM84418.1 metallophosphoesterase [Methanococcus aeolicus]